MAYVPVPKDLSKVKTKVAFNLTKRQIVCFAAALIIGLPLFFLLKDSTGTSLASMAMIAVMLPCFLFAMYYYLHELKHYDVRIIGLDLKADVIAHCQQLAEDYGYEKLTFLTGDIADYDGVDHVDMVVTLHACDTATDYALDKAVRWGAKVILSVPCCQHEVNRQIENELLQPVLKYGLIKERMSALLTDAIRANLLEEAGYQVQVLEFIDMEHTPKNILLRAVKSGRQKRAEELTKMMEKLHVSPTLAALMREERDAADA